MEAGPDGAECFQILDLISISTAHTHTHRKITLITTNLLITYCNSLPLLLLILILLRIESCESRADNQNVITTFFQSRNVLIIMNKK